MKLLVYLELHFGGSELLWKKFSLGECEENDWRTLLFFLLFSSWQRKRVRSGGNNLIWGIWSPVFSPMGNLHLPFVVNIFIDAAHSYPSVRSNCNFQNCKSNRIIPNSCSFSMKLWSNIPSSFNFISSAGPESYCGDL